MRPGVVLAGRASGVVLVDRALHVIGRAKLHDPRYIRIFQVKIYRAVFFAARVAVPVLPAATLRAVRDDGLTKSRGEWLQNIVKNFASVLDDIVLPLRVFEHFSFGIFGGLVDRVAEDRQIRHEFVHVFSCLIFPSLCLFLEGEAFDEMMEALTLQAQEESLVGLQ